MEDSTGFDANNDGCIDSITELGGMLPTLVEEGLIDANMQNSLVSKVENSEKSVSKDNICAAVNQLEAFKNQISAKRGNGISEDAANLLVNYANNLIRLLMAGLPEVDNCN